MTKPCERCGEPDKFRVRLTRCVYCKRLICCLCREHDLLTLGFCCAVSVWHWHWLDSDCFALTERHP